MKERKEQMEKRNRLKNQIKIFLCAFSLILTGCSTIGLAQDATFESAYENVPEEEAVDIYISQSTVVIESVNELEGTVTAYLTDRNESRTFTYNGACTVADKYGNPMSMAQLKAGDIADFAYNSELERVGRINLTADAWSQETIRKYALNVKGRNVTIGEEVYSLSESAKAFSGGQAITLEEILRDDVLSFHGRGNTILSITVDKGHGYLNLTGEDNFLGGWIEVGQTLISSIQPDMLFTVPEGTYAVRMTVGDVEEIRLVTIERNKETVLDLSDVEFPQPVNGRVVFQIVPEDAEVYVDDQAIDTDLVVRLPFGIHRVTAEAAGYDTLSEYFEVEGELTTVKMSLTEGSSVSGNTVSGYEKDEPTITIDVPQDVEVYEDNLYKGIAPVTYEKTAGTHTITLRKTGYITKSYEIQVPDDNMDVTYSFPALNAEGTVSGNDINSNSDSSDSVSDNSTVTSSVSGNTVSGNSVSDNSIQ